MTHRLLMGPAILITQERSVYWHTGKNRCRYSCLPRLVAFRKRTERTKWLVTLRWGILSSQNWQRTARYRWMFGRIISWLSANTHHPHFTFNSPNISGWSRVRRRHMNWIWWRRINPYNSTVWGKWCGILLRIIRLHSLHSQNSIWNCRLPLL